MHTKTVSKITEFLTTSCLPPPQDQLGFWIQNSRNIINELEFWQQMQALKLFIPWKAFGTFNVHFVSEILTSFSQISLLPVSRGGSM